VRHRLAAHLLGRRQGMIVDDDLHKARVTFAADFGQTGSVVVYVRYVCVCVRLYYDNDGCLIKTKSVAMVRGKGGV